MNVFSASRLGEDQTNHNAVYGVDAVKTTSKSAELAGKTGYIPVRQTLLKTISALRLRCSAEILRAHQTSMQQAVGMSGFWSYRAVALSLVLQPQLRFDVIFAV